MELLDRYLEAVRLWLPQARREDILRELADDIRSQAEDREAELGRPLTLDDEAELLKQFGNPLWLGLRYRRQRQLIGPVIFPFYWWAVKIALAVVAIFWALGVAAMIGSHRPLAEFLRTPDDFLHAALPAIGWITILFAAVEYFAGRLHVNRWGANWDPRTLPPVTQNRPIPRAKSLKGLIFDVGFGIWFLVALQNPQLLWGSLPYQLAPVWLEMYPLFVALVLVSVAQRVINLLRPDWTWLPSVSSLIVTLGALIVAYRLYDARVVILGSVADRTLAIINGSIMITVGISIAVAAPLVAVCTWQSVRQVLRSRVAG
jgi:hypothetical protein